MKLVNLKILGIFDRQDITFDFRTSPFFLVGPNGTGKSTALKILHNILTAQWGRLPNILFLGIEIHFDEGEPLVFERMDFAKFDRLQGYLTKLTRRPNRKVSEPYPPDWKTASAFLSGSPISSIRSNRRLSPAAIDKLSEGYEPIVRLMNFVETQSKGQVLYFPTYRRVEKDLSGRLEIPLAVRL